MEQQLQGPLSSRIGLSGTGCDPAHAAESHWGQSLVVAAWLTAKILIVRAIFELCEIYIPGVGVCTAN